MKNKLTYFSGIGLILGSIIMILSILISSMPNFIQIIGVVLFLANVALMLASTGNKNNISIVFSFFTVLGVIVSIIFVILISLGVIKVNSYGLNYGNSSILSIIFLLTIVFTSASATLTFVSSTISDTDTIRTLRSATVGLTVAIAIMSIISLFVPFLALTLYIIVTIAEVILGVTTVFLLVIDKQESIENITVLSSKCNELQKTVANLQTELEKNKQESQSSMAQLEQLKKANTELSTNAEYYSKLYAETKQEALYNQQQLMMNSQQQVPQQSLVAVTQPESTPTPKSLTSSSPIPTIKLNNN